MPVIINGTTGISGVDGSAASPAIEGSDTNTGMFFPAADTIAFAEGGVEAMRINSSGNVNVGSSSINDLRYLDISNPDTGASAGSILRLISSNAAGSGNVAVNIVKYKNGAFVISNTETDAAAHTAFNVGASERFRIGSAGQLGIAGANYGTSGQALLSGGSGAAPSWGSPAALSTASGSAPSYSARAWVNFNGTGTVAIRASGNVTSITDGGTGVYSVNFTTSMPSADYACNVTPDNFGVNIPLAFSSVARGNTTALAKIGTSSNTGTSTDCSQVNVTVTV
jgi:hypothetical protein